ncbi:PfkB family carbohydrate kinase [Microbacterium sp. LRZ72]|uniref:PfkB family carbohydrate kinase n=1 Tax=Microbacterium sp. LRZ72 TaxID=2942481 RepID=UPI0029A37522|nr:PfkB family carbohydrate kinase [Microbacterium sp. LRZ72]MDX2378110.1 PfkB family carbohydrate kinase [Microbacterium sp. LRZ72]
MSDGRVVVVGDALIDELRDERGVREFVGGAALNVAVGLSRLGVAATLIAMVGDDEAGAKIRSYLEDFGVELIATASPVGSSRAVSVRASGGEPTYEFNAAARGRRIRFGESERAALAAASAIVISCFPFDDVDQATELADAVEASTAPLIIDPNPRDGMMRDLAAFVSGFEALVPRAALVKVGDDDAALMYEQSVDETVARMRSLGAPVVFCTRGAAGAGILAEGMDAAAPVAVLRGRVVDTMGAGDAALAATVTALIDDAAPRTSSAWQDVLEETMRIAAATCRFEGALLRTPDELRDVDIDSIGT